jgi:hypothetical protein
MSPRSYLRLTNLSGLSRIYQDLTIFTSSQSANSVKGVIVACPYAQARRVLRRSAGKRVYFIHPETAFTKAIKALRPVSRLVSSR